MLQPKRTKFRKMHKGRIHGEAKGGSDLNFGHFGLKATEPMQRDLMSTYSASYWQTLVKLRLPAAMPFLFNGLKIATTPASPCGSWRGP